jgi:hypothetical protein
LDFLRSHQKWQIEIREECSLFDPFPRDAKIPNFNNHTRRKRLRCANSKFTSLRLARIRMTKTGKYEDPAPNPQSVFVLNFENWDLQIVWNLGFEYWNKSDLNLGANSVKLFLSEP